METAMRRSAVVRAVIVSAVLTLLMLLYLWAAGLEGVPYFGFFGESASTKALVAAISIAMLAFATGVVAYRLMRGAIPRWMLADADAHHGRYRLCCHNRKSILLGTLVLFLCWLPVAAVFFPGVVTYDGVNQLYQYAAPAPTWYPTTGDLLDAEFIDHHPVFDTLLYGFFVFDVGGLLGSQNAGLFAFVCLQLGLTAFSIAFSLCFLQELGISHRMRLGLLVAACLCLFFPANAAAMLKDTLHAPLFLLFFCLFVQTMRSRGNALQSSRFFAGIVLLSLACMLSKKTGACIVLPSLLVAACMLRSAQACALAALPVIVGLVLVPLLVYPAIGGVAKGGMQEAMALPLQQSVAVAHAHYDELDACEKEAVDAIIDLEWARAHFDPALADPAKDTFRADATAQDLATYFGVWLGQGARYPALYLKTTVQCVGALFVPAKGLSFYRGIDDSLVPELRKQAANSGGEFALTLQAPSALDAVAEKLQVTVDGRLARWPISSLAISRGLYGGWLPLLALMVALFCRRSHALWLVPIALATLSLLACPADDARYVLPLFYSCPVFLGVMLNAAAQKPARPA